MHGLDSFLQRGMRVASVPFVLRNQGHREKRKVDAQLPLLPDKFQVIVGPLCIDFRLFKQKMRCELIAGLFLGPSVAWVLLVRVCAGTFSLVP